MFLLDYFKSGDISLFRKLLTAAEYVLAIAALCVWWSTGVTTHLVVGIIVLLGATAVAYGIHRAGSFVWPRH